MLALIVNLVAALFAFGVAFRLRTIQAGPAMQMPVFLILFFAPVYVPLALLSGWVEAVAKVNPFTALVEGGRDLISGQSFDASSPTGSRPRSPRCSGSGRCGGCGRLKRPARYATHARAAPPPPPRSRACGRSSRGGTRSSSR